MKTKITHCILALLCLAVCQLPVLAQRQGTLLSGKILSADNSIVDFATVYLKGTKYGCMTNEKGIYHLKAPAGTYTLIVSAVGFETVEKEIRIAPDGRTRQNIVLQPSLTELEEVEVVASGISRVKKSAFNAVAVDTKELQNSTKNLGEALQQLPGMKLRESGGVGSDMQLMLDGFSGNHVKVFIDGVPQEGAGTAFDINNIPVNYAERIEVYKGVVPVGFGTDAIGGVINIVTNKSKRNWFLDASYSYGSFNTHKSYVNFGQTFANGFTYEVNAFQNFSDNDYYIDNEVRRFEIMEDGSIYFPPQDGKKYRVKRFNDQFHNEAVIAKLGFTGKTWADRLMFSLGYTHFYKEIQTGVYQETVFGEKFRHGYSLMPSVEYKKHNLLVRNLDLTLTANYNHNFTNNVDTASRHYNWLGEYYDNGVRGEQAYQRSQSKNTNWNATGNLNYRFGRIHTLTFHHVASNFRRTSRSYTGTSSVLTAFDIPKVTRKNISGLSYRVVSSEKWNASVFGKHYHQFNQGPVSTSSDGVGNYQNMEKTVSAWGYGAAGTYYIYKELQAKVSYEKAYRLPTTDELFGDEDLEAGKTDLRPENSHNLNFNLSYGHSFGKHGLYAEASYIYRDTKDYIKRGFGKNGTTQFGIYENHGHVKTKGYTVSLRYNFSHWFNMGGTYNNIDTRNHERYVTGGSLQESVTYKKRLPNIPYRYANLDATFTWRNLFAKGNTFSLTYDSFWQHDFPLYWEGIGKDKNMIPEQFSHNLSMSYSLKNGRYNFSFECRNLTNEKLYDNFSLQKAGRAFYGKVRVHFGK